MQLTNAQQIKLIKEQLKVSWGMLAKGTGYTVGAISNAIYRDSASDAMLEAATRFARDYTPEIRASLDGGSIEYRLPTPEEVTMFKDYLIKYDMTQVAFAAMTGISRGVINKMVNGQQNINPAHINTIMEHVTSPDPPPEQYLKRGNGRRPGYYKGPEYPGIDWSQEQPIIPEPILPQYEAATRPRFTYLPDFASEPDEPTPKQPSLILPETQPEASGGALDTVGALVTALTNSTAIEGAELTLRVNGKAVTINIKGD